MESCAKGPTPIIVAEVRHAGGAMARVDPAGSAFSHRTAPHSMELIGMAPTAEAQTAFRQHVSQLKQALQPHLTGGVYLNFLEGEEARAHSRHGFSAEAYRRLQAIKAVYDPGNRFDHGYNLASDAAHND